MTEDKKHVVEDYEEKCDCSEDDKCGCSWPNNTTKDYNKAEDVKETAGANKAKTDCGCCGNK